MHKWSCDIMTALKNRVDEVGVENISGQVLDDMKDWTSICKNITQFEYYYKVIEAMENAEEKEFTEKMHKYAPETNL